MSISTLNFRPVQMEDCDWIKSALSHKNVAKNTSQIPHPITTGFVTEWVRSWIYMADQQTGFRIIGLSPDNRGFGSAALKKAEDYTAEISFWIAPEFWGQGLATQIIRETIHRARVAQLKNLTAGHFVDNLGSQALLTKFGFVRELQTIGVPSLCRGQIVETIRYKLPL